MKTIGLIAAMSKELRLMLPLIDNIVTEEVEGYTFHRGTLNGNNIVLMQCGIGKVNAAIGALTMINRYSPQLIINSGVAGGASADINVMDIVVCEDIAYHDVWCGPGTVPGEAADCPLYFHSAPEYADLAYDCDFPQMRRGLICSGDRFIDSIEEVKHIQSIFPQVLAVDMESAAIAQVCHRKDVKFLCLRVISDSPGASHNNVMQYENFWEEAPEHVFDTVKSFLLKL